MYILFGTIWSRLSRFLDSDSLKVIQHLEINYCELNLSDVFEMVQLKAALWQSYSRNNSLITKTMKMQINTTCRQTGTKSSQSAGSITTHSSHDFSLNNELWLAECLPIMLCPKYKTLIQASKIHQMKLWQAFECLKVGHFSISHLLSSRLLIICIMYSAKIISGEKTRKNKEIKEKNQRVEQSINWWRPRQLS